jgi:hypothetical protein
MALDCDTVDTPIYTLNLTDFYAHNVLLGETTEAIPIYFNSTAIDKE